MVRTPASWKTFLDSNNVRTQHNVEKKDVVVPIVRWNDPPQVEVSSLHVFHLPVSQPSQNSSFLASNESRKLSIDVEKQHDARYHLCVFAGTVDGTIVYWRFEHDSVAQVNMLVFPRAGSRRQPVVGMVSGTDEWGQSMLISVTMDGTVVRWQLPNGACAEADASLAKELSPLLGLEMLSNRRFALVVSKVSRLMVLDTWKMQLLYCVDTAQEQIRRSVAVGELSMSRPKSPRRKVIRSTNGLRMETKSRGANADPAVVEGGRVSPSRSSPAGGAKYTDALPLSNHAATEHRTQQWDAVVISLGADGLVKCFLWTQPRGSTDGTSCNVTSGGASAHNTWGFWWVQRSTWVISWADRAEDITCSQSTSLRDGDNLNPQTALMGSIKNSYFPHSVKMSPDSSLVLLVWRTKFVVLERSWLCSLESCRDSQARSERSGKSRTTGVGSCRVSPAEFLRQAAETHGSENLDTCNDGDGSGSVEWENGKFLENGNVVLWTNTGQVFQFLPAESSSKTAGNLFIFTKDQDQLVPRSDSKELGVFKQAVYVASMDCCACCKRVLQKDDRSQTKLKRLNALLAEGRRHPGYMSCIGSGSSTLESTVQIVHMCYRGTVRRRTMPMVSIPSPRRVLHNSENVIIARMPLAQKTWFHSLTDGYEAAARAARDKSSDKNSTDKKACHKSQRRHCLTHFVIGRQETQSTSPFEVAWRTRLHHKRQQSPDDARRDSAKLPIIADTVAPVTERSEVRNTEDQLEVNETDQKEYEYSDYRYLLDVPIIVKGFPDGRIVIELLSQEHLSSEYGGVLKDTATRLSCHSGRVTALAHCCLGVGSATSSCPKAASSRRTSTDILKETYFATTRNPFYRARFPDLTTRRFSESPVEGDSEKRQVVFNSDHRSSFTMKMQDDHGTLDECSPDAAINHPALNFVLLSGGSDGVLCVVELILYHPPTRDDAGRSVRLTARTLQKFRNHRGAIRQISLSPFKRGITGSSGENWVAEYPDRWIATVGVDCKVVVYAPQYLRKSSSRHSRARGTLTQRSNDRFCIEWKCMFQLSEHAGCIRNLDWHLERGLLYVQCDDQMVYVWSTDTGILERTIPCALVYGGGGGDGNSSDIREEANSGVRSAAEFSTLSIGNATVQLIQLSVLRSAEQLKKNWTSYFSSHFRSNSTVGECSNVDLQPSQASVYATSSMELFMLSLLLSWGITPAIDQSCRNILGIKPARALYSCALQDSVSEALTIPVPWLTLTNSSLMENENPAKLESELAMPIMPSFARNWQHSSALSASIALGVVSLCMNCMDFEHPESCSVSMSSVNKEEFQVLWSQLITQYSVVLPECVAQFREPALEELAAFGFDSCKHTQLAARTLLSNVIKRLRPSERSILSAEYSTKLHWEMVRLEIETGGSFVGACDGIGTAGSANSSSQLSGNCATGRSSNNAGARSHPKVVAFSLVVERLGPLVLLMSMIGTYFPGEISPACAREVCNILVFLLKAPERFVASVSSELLMKGLMLFRPHLVELSSLIVQLLLIDVREKQCGAPSGGGEDIPSAPGGSLANFQEGGTGGSNAAMSLLVEVGAYESTFVLKLLHREMYNLDRPPGFHESILLCMMELVSTHYLLMCRHLPVLVGTVMACLDPTKPDRRRRCLALSTRCLHSLVQRFPMVDFHKETQRLALGTMEAVIVIYDLRTATKWRVLDGHASAVSAVRFRADGRVLVSYAARDGSVRWWNSGNAGLFGGMLKMHQSCLKEHTLTAVTEGPNGGGAPASMGGASAGLKQIIQTCRFHFLTRTDTPRDNGSRSNLNEPLKQHILRLTREDASQVQFLL